MIMTRCFSLRRICNILRKYVCFCFHKSNEDFHVIAETDTGDQDIIRLPVATNVQSIMIRPGSMTLERWTSAPIFINIPPPTQFQQPVSPVGDRPRKRLSSPGRIDVSLIDQIKEELKETERGDCEPEDAKNVKNDK
ncbi:uncharacterized protein LOC128989673 isoform X1 [Macrosteles quadrilineatus]|uniref:uncharacterized protein LOC128989673 isoform X1 n=2 Tax=Macrosteles quadrilineatus TaxID=74068 RepID=UPI0023E2D96D|nr:uncharacterized protein LOC128989673 isoform X1 [Macrosteles quadrilineatus]